MFELLGLNLYQLLKRNSFRGLSISLIKRFSLNILQSLSFLSKSNIIHCDLKPENILLSDSSLNSVKLIDFGSSCLANQKVFSYIQSRFYRAPEVVLEIPYTSSIDMWSFGCILAELYTGFPIFPMESEEELIKKIVEVIGLPPVDFIAQGSRSYKYFSTTEKIIGKDLNLQQNPQKTISAVLRGADVGLICLIEKCLQWDPKKRPTPEAALAFSWLDDTSRSRFNRKCRISMEDITKHTPRLQKFIAHRSNVHSLGEN